MARVILVSGCPGTGKTSLIEEFDGPGVDMDKYGYWFKSGNNVNWYINTKSIADIIERLKKVAEVIIFAGLCNNMWRKGEYYDMECRAIKKASHTLAGLDWTDKYWLTYDPEHIVERVTKRSNPYGKTAKQREEIKNCIETWSNPTGFTVIDTSDITPKEVLAQILEGGEQESQSQQEEDKPSKP